MIPNDALVNSADILARTSVFSGSTGQRDDTWGTVVASGVPCRRDKLEYSRYVSGTEDALKVSDILLFNVSSTIQFLVKENHIKIGTEEFRIVRCNPLYSEKDYAGIAQIDHYEVEVLLIV